MTEIIRSAGVLLNIISQHQFSFHPPKTAKKSNTGYINLYSYEKQSWLFRPPQMERFSNVQFPYMNSPYLVTPAVCATVYTYTRSKGCLQKKSIAIIIVIYHHHNPSSAVVSHHILHAKCGCALLCWWIAENCHERIAEFLLAAIVKTEWFFTERCINMCYKAQLSVESFPILTYSCCKIPV